MADYEHLEAATAQSEQRPDLGMFASWIGAGLSSVSYTHLTLPTKA